MSAELARRWFKEVWNERKIDTIKQFASADTIAHHEWGDVKGLDSFRMHHAEFISAMPDLVFDVEDAVDDGKGNVVVRWMLRGCHSGKGLSCPATNQKIQIRGMTWMVVKDGKIVEGWDTFNFDGLMGTLAGKPRSGK